MDSEDRTQDFGGVYHHIDEIIPLLSVTDIHAVRDMSTEDYDAVVTVCQDDVSEFVSGDYHFFKLADGPEDEKHRQGEFSYELFESAVETVIDHVENNDETLVHCHAGRSRSPMVVAAAITHLHDVSVDEAISIVDENRTHGVSYPFKAMEDFIRRFAENEKK